MPIISVRIPQMGEGLQEALLVEFLKQPGDRIQRDEPIYVMETDKATTDVESPYSGTLIEWTVEPGSVLAIGSEIARMDVADGAREMPAGHGGASPVAANNQNSANASDRSTPATEVLIPPKTRKALKDAGLLDEIDKIPVRGSKMMPEDVEAYLASRSSSPSQHVGAPQDSGRSSAGRSETDEPHTIVPLPKSQVTLNYRMARGAGVCIPVTVVADMDWTAIQTLRQNTNSNGNPTGFSMACWAVVQAMKQHDKFRSILTPDGSGLKVFQHVNLGIAVALPGDEMLTAVIRQADQMTQSQFYQAYDAQVQSARQGQDQADETTTLTVSNIGKAGMRIGIPAIVSPAVATLAIGEVFQQPVPDGDSFKFRPTATATLSFDHRIVNGVGAANFLNDVRKMVESM